MSTTNPVVTPSSLALGEVDVAIVRWPEEASIRHALAALGRPRLLLVDPGAQPPDPLGGPEDWLRWPPDPAELLFRAQHLSQRAGDTAPLAVELDDDGLLRRGDHWVAISEAQLPVLRLLLANVDRVVRFDAIVQAYESGGGSGHPASVRTGLSRLEARLRSIGIDVESVRRRGVILRSTPAYR
jgi:hypothetical protein